MLEAVPGEVDLLITDPPYNINYEGKAGKIENDNMESEEFYTFLNNAFTNAHSVMKDGAAFYVWYASKESINFESSLNDSGLSVKQQLIWAKNHFTMGRQDYQWQHEPCLYGWKEGAAHSWYGDRKASTIMNFDKPLKSELHPTMKPVELIAEQIKNNSKEGDKVLDLFGGSGTTLIAAEQLNRQCYIMEYDERYASVILKRYEEITGDKGCYITSII